MGRSLAELSEQAATPTTHGSVGEDGAGVMSTRANADGLLPSRIDWGQAIAHRVDLGVAQVPMRKAELSKCIEFPAFQATLGGHRAGALHPQTDAGHFHAVS